MSFYLTDIKIPKFFAMMMIPPTCKLFFNSGTFLAKLGSICLTKIVLKTVVVNNIKQQVHSYFAANDFAPHKPHFRATFFAWPRVTGNTKLDYLFLHCSNNNRAETVLQLFMKAVTEFGLPSRLRTDKGGENTSAALYMLQHPLRGTGRGSVIAGSSTHNQRIERLWRDVLFLVVFCVCILSS